MRGSGPAGRARFAPVTILTLGNLQLWVVPVLDAEATAPVGLVACSPDVRPLDLRPLAHPATAEGVTIKFS